MSVRYQYEGDYVVAAAASFQPDEDFGAPRPPPQASAACVAAVLLVGAFGGYQDEWPTPAQSFFPDEDFPPQMAGPQQAPIPLAAALELDLYSSFTNGVEDSAQFLPLPGPQPPQPAPAFLDQDDVPLLFGQPDEDFPPPLPAPVPGQGGKLYLPDPELLPAGALFGQPDEDFWQGPQPAVLVAPQPAVLDSGEYAPAPVAFQPDEDYGQPVVPGVAQSTPRAFLDTDEAGFLVGQPDEDFYQPRPPWPLTTTQAFTADDTWVPYVALQLQDEDFPGPVAGPWPLTTAKPFLDQDEVPAGSLRGTVDEDFFEFDALVPWPQQLVPVAQYSDEAPQTPFQPDEDTWTVARVFSQPAPQPVAWADGDFAPPTAALDEGLWIVPRIWNNPAPQPVIVADADYVTPPTPLRVDEVYPGPFPRPVVAANFISLPYGPDLDNSFAPPFQPIIPAPDRTLYIGTREATIYPRLQYARAFSIPASSRTIYIK